ncbi:MFS transporter [Guptibacillus sedimenti]|uniref:MFS transporter n=1 Tax=Guptibacillus sedimenti TaxID=3025680 RepID=UPI00235FF2E0|nr:MFS transporter [Pseudalkalibacillus sedimenti]
MNVLTKKQINVNIIIFTISKTIAALGGNVYAFGMGLYILSLTGSASNFAIGLICSVVPRILFGSIAGVWADRFSKKKIIISAQIIQAITLSTFFIIGLSSEISLLLIYGTTIILSICSTFSSITFTSSIPSLVSEEKIQKATSLNQSAVSFAMIGAPILGGFLYSFLTINTFILANAITYLLSATLDGALKFSKKISDDESLMEENNFWSDIKSGFSYIKSNSFLFKILIPVGLLVNFFGVSLQVGLPYIVVERLELTSYQFGIIEGSMAIGMLVMSIILSTKKENKNPLNNMKVGLLALSILFGLLTVPLIWDISSIIVFIYYVSLQLSFGLIVVFLNTPLYVLMQKIISGEYRGRVFGIVETLANVITPVGMIIYGFLFDYLNPSWILVTSALAILLIALLKLKSSSTNRVSTKISEVS